MSKVVSEDSERRYLAAMNDEQSAQWLRGQLRECYGPLLLEPWGLDVGTTIKPVFGHQDAAKKGIFISGRIASQTFVNQWRTRQGSNLRPAD